MGNIINKFIVFIILIFFSLALNAASNDTTGSLQKAGNAVGDSAITTNVNSKLSRDKTLRTIKIVVHTTNGVVTLTGIVNTDTQADQAMTLAAGTEGVKDVNADKLTVKESTQPMSDMLITAKIKGKLLQEKIMGNKDVAFWPVRVETKDGVAYLSGQLDSQEQINNIVKIARVITGVKDVKNLMTTKVATPASGTMKQRT